MKSLINTIQHIDFFDLLAQLEDASIDIPQMWDAFKRVIKPRGAIVLTATQPFASMLVSSNYKMFRYALVWDKKSPTGFLDANRKPMPAHEDVLIFGHKRPDYYPQMGEGTPYKAISGGGASVYHGHTRTNTLNDGKRYPTSVISIPNVTGLGITHPTQKPVALFEYLIKTYTQAGDVVLDPCVGSGTTAIASRKTGRNFICGDLSAEYVAIANKRLRDTDPYTATEIGKGKKQLSLFEELG